MNKEQEQKCLQKLNELPDGIRELAIQAFNVPAQKTWRNKTPYHVSVANINLYGSLVNSFLWAVTKEEHDFWSAVADDARERRL